MLCAQFPFAGSFRGNDGIQGDLVEDIEHLRYPGHWAWAVTAGIPYPKMLCNGIVVGNHQRGAIDRGQGKPMPCLGLEIVFKEVDGRFVEFFESLGLELISGLAKGAFRDHTQKRLALANGLEEIIKFVLVGPFDQVHQKENDVVEREYPLAGEAFGTDAV